MKTRILSIVLVLVAGLLLTGTAFAQSQPSGLTFHPARIAPGECYSIAVADGANMTVDIQITYPGGSATITNWLTLDTNGENHDMCTASTQPLGAYSITAIRNTLNTAWVSNSSSLNVVSTPSALTFTPTSVEQGHCFIASIPGWVNEIIDIQVIWPGASTPSTVTGWRQLDGSGELHNCFGDDLLGTYTFTAFRTMGNTNWISSGSTLEITPRQPTTLSFSVPTVHPGGTYVWNVGNAANLALDVYVQSDQETPYTGIGSPALDASGHATINLGTDQALGHFHVTKIRNTLATAWVNVDATIEVCGAAAPTITGVSPQGAAVNTVTTVTISGSNLCNITSVTGGSDVTVNNLQFGYRGTAISLDVTVSPTATPGVKTITVNTPNGNVPFYFNVGPPTVSDVSPNNGTRGTSGILTITGTNLSGATASGNNGLSVTVTGTSATTVTANYSIACDATLGNATITVINNGMPVTAIFTINNVSTPTISSISPSSAVRGSSLSVTLHGSGLCGTPTLSTSWGGLSFSGGSAAGTSATATFTIDSGAAAGTPSITVTNSAGSTAFSYFSITGPALSKEYIYLGDRVLAVDAP